MLLPTRRMVCFPWASAQLRVDVCYDDVTGNGKKGLQTALGLSPVTARRLPNIRSVVIV